jgi:hypothetical protein
MATNVHEIGHGYCNQNIFLYPRETGLMGTPHCWAAELLKRYKEEKMS